MREAIKLIVPRRRARKVLREARKLIFQGVNLQMSYMQRLGVGMPPIIAHAQRAAHSATVVPSSAAIPARRRAQAIQSGQVAAQQAKSFPPHTGVQRSHRPRAPTLATLGEPKAPLGQVEGTNEREGAASPTVARAEADVAAVAEPTMARVGADIAAVVDSASLRTLEDAAKEADRSSSAQAEREPGAPEQPIGLGVAATQTTPGIDTVREQKGANAERQVSAQILTERKQPLDTNRVERAKAEIIRALADVGAWTAAPIWTCGAELASAAMRLVRAQCAAMRTQAVGEDETWQILQSGPSSAQAPAPMAGVAAAATQPIAGATGGAGVMAAAMQPIAGATGGGGALAITVGDGMLGRAALCNCNCESGVGVAAGALLCVLIVRGLPSWL